MGNLNPLGNGGAPVSFPLGKPRPLTGMSKRAKRYFNAACKIMLEAGNLQIVDGDVLSIYCTYLDHWVTENQLLVEEGCVVEDWRKQKVKNPRLNAVRELGQQLNAYSSKLGFSPADRERIKVRAKKEKSALEKFMDEHGI